MTLSSGNSLFVVHRNAIGSIVQPVAVDDEDVSDVVAPDDDPEFGGQNFDDDSDGSGPGSTNTGDQPRS